MEQSDLKDRNDDFPVTPMTETHPYALPDLYAAEQENPFKGGVNEAGEQAKAVSASNVGNPELEGFSLASGPSGYTDMDDNFMGTPFSADPSLDGMMPNYNPTSNIAGINPFSFAPGVYPPGCFDPGSMMTTPFTTQMATPFSTQMLTPFTTQYPGLYPGMNQQGIYPAGSFPYSMPGYMPSTMYGSYMEPPFMMMMQMMQAIMQQMTFLLEQIYRNIPGQQPCPTRPPGQPEQYPHLPAAATPQWLNTLISG